MSLKHDATWTLIDTWIKSLEDASPINILFLTHPISTSITSRIKSLELLYTKSSLYRFLLKKGVYPLLLFTTVSGGIGYGLQRTYTRSTKLVLNLLGVLYPTWACWKLIKQRASEKGEQEEEQLKSWLTYWMIFGSFQVLDHWMESDLLLFSKKKYYLYKLFILYWAQNPHSNGAQLLYRHVIQKPPVNKTKKKDLVETSLEKKKEKKKEQESSIILFQQEEEEEEEEHTITITGAATATTAYSYLDGYHPPSLPLVEHITHSSSSDDDDSIHSQPQQSNNTILIPSSTTTTTQQEKETFLPLSYTIETTTSTIESAW